MTAAAAGPQRASVVVIDDTPDFRLLLRMMLDLSDDFHVVGEAGDGAAGIEIVRQRQPDLVTLDLAMPVMDGLEALPGIRSACPGAAVVVMSGFEAGRMAEQAIALGAASYLQKGAEPESILTALHNALGRPLRAAADANAAASTAAGDAGELETLRSAMGTAAHELRTPATILIGLAQTLIRRRNELPPGQVDELLDAIVRQTRVVDRVTADLLTSTQMSHGAIAVNVQPMDLVPAIRAAVNAVADQLSIRLESPERLMVVGDVVRVQQMLTNLVSNAMKYAEPPINITVATHSEVADVSVDDSGVGVPAEFRGQLFDRYSRALGSRVAGTGLGLYVVRTLAEAQDGTAYYQPLPDGGSRFGFTLPLR